MVVKKPRASGSVRKTKTKTPVAGSPVASKNVAAQKVAENQPAANMVRRKEMVERIVARSGLKPNTVKSVLDAVLQELGDALSAGESLNLHPLGKVTVSRSKTLGSKEILMCKIRRKLASEGEPAALDTAAE